MQRRNIYRLILTSHMVTVLCLVCADAAPNEDLE